MATATATATETQELNVENVELRRLGSKDLDRIRLSRQPYPGTDTLAHHADLFLIANTLGVAAWITPSLDTLQFAPTASLRQAYAADSHDQASAVLAKATRSVKLPLAGIHHLALASTGDILIAATNTVVALDAASLASGSATELFRTTLPSDSDSAKITHLYPNPNPTSDPSLHLLLALTASGSLHILNLAANGTLVRSITGQSITAATWSPKGKQLVYATANRALTRVDPLTGKIAGTHAPCPPLADFDPFEAETCRVVALVWTDPMAIAVLSVNSDQERMFCTAVLNWKSNAYVISEPTAPFPAISSLKPPHTYVRALPHYPGAPNLTLVAATSSLETHTLFTAPDPDTNTTGFSAVLLNENARAVLPNDDDLEHVPVGMALDLTSHESLPPLSPDDPRRVPATPILWIMTDVGEVVGWHVYEMDCAAKRKAYEGMVDPVVKSVEDVERLAKAGKGAGAPPPPPPPVPAGKPAVVKVAPVITAPAPAPAASPFAFTSTSAAASKAPDTGKPLFGAAAATTKPFSAFAGAGAATGFGAFGSTAAAAAKSDDNKATKPFSFGSGAPSFAAAAAAKDAAGKPAESKPVAFGAPAASANASPAAKPLGFGAASPGAASLFAPKQPPAAPVKPTPAAGGFGFGFATQSVSPPKVEAGGKRKAEEEQAPSAQEEEDEQQQEDESEQDGYESESESESEESEQDQTPPPAPAPVVPQTRPRLVQRFKIQSEDADEPAPARAPTTPARLTSSSARATPRTLQIPTFTPSKSTPASGLANVTTICTNLAGTLDMLHTKRREIALRIKDHVGVMDAWEDRVADVRDAKAEVDTWQAEVDAAMSRAMIVKAAVDRTRAKVAEIQELIKQMNDPEAAGAIGEELGPEQVEGRQRIMAGLDKVRTRLRQLEAFAAQQAADEKERRRGKARGAAEAQEARVSMHSLHLAFKRMHEAIEARAEGVESLVLTMQMMNLVDVQHKGTAAADVVGGESTILEPPTVLLASGKPAETSTKPKPKVPGFRALLDKYRRPVDPTAAVPAMCIEPTLPVGVGWRCTQCKVRNARLAPQCAKCSAPKVIERAAVPDREPEPVVAPSPLKPMTFSAPPPPVTPVGLHVRKEPRQPVVQTIESPAAPVPGLDDVEPVHDDPTPTKKRTKRGKPNSDAAAPDSTAKSGGRSRTSSSGKPIGNKPKSLSQSSLVPTGGFSMSFAEPSKPDVSPPPPPAAAAPASGGFKLAFAKPAGWACDSCMVNNPVDATKCVSCETAKPGAKPAPPAFTAPAASSGGFKLPFAKPAGWTCDSCMVPNKEEATKCVSCEAAKPGAKAKPAASAFQPPAPSAGGGFKLPFAKPTGWTCDSCLVPNKAEATKCASCETAKPGAKPAPVAFQPPAPAAAGGFKLPFAKPAGWTCDSCLVPNKDDATKCASCETAKPGSKPAASAAPPAFVPPPATAASRSSSSGDKAVPALPPSGTGFTFGGKPATGAGFGAFAFGKPAAAKDGDSAASAMPAFGCFPPTDGGIPGNPTAAPTVPFGFKPPTAEAKSSSPDTKQQDKRSRSPSPAPKPASPPKPSTPSPTRTRDASPAAAATASSSAQQARASSPPRTPTPGASVAAVTAASTGESARDDDGFEQIAGFETMGESLMLGGSLVLLDNETMPESAGMDEDMSDDAPGGNVNSGGGAGDDAMDEAIDSSNDAFSGFSLGQPSASTAVNPLFGGFGGQAQQQQQQQQPQQREQGASAFGWKATGGAFSGAAGSKPSAFGPVGGGGGAFGGASSGAPSAFGGSSNTAQSAFGGFGSSSPAPTNAFGGGAAAAGPAFGQPAALGGGGAPAFGQSSGLGGSSVGFGQPSALGAGAAFGQSSSFGANASAFGRPSGFGAAAAGAAPAFGATSGFGAAAAASTGFGAFGSANQQQQQQSSGGFGAFAGQSPQRVGFGAFASGSSGQVSFGSPVAQNQQQQQQQQPSQPQTTPSRTGLFGFSGYRG